MPISYGDRNRTTYCCTWCKDITEGPFCEHCGHDPLGPRHLCECDQCKARRERLAQQNSAYH